MHMKISQGFAAIFAAAFILSAGLPVSAAETTTVSGNEIETVFPVPDQAPPFHARIELRMGYTVIGTFTDLTPDIVQIQPLYSWDGENWQDSTRDWNLFGLATADEYKLKGLQKQPCLFHSDEPLKSYIAGEIDRFYLKLRITKENGLSYETQFAVIQHDGLQPIPEGAERRACFSSAIAVYESDPAVPYGYRKYGRYQLTVSANATAQDISSLLPDTLPVEVQIDHGSDFIAIGIIDCPVTWKPLSLPPLSPGESITISDAAEDILVPNGTLVSTPIGTFQLDQPLSLDMPPSTDEISLVLNINSEDKNLTETDIYQQLPNLPGIHGAEGNEINAGADNQGDSTESGQRPNLPQEPDLHQEGPQPTTPPPSDDNQEEEQQAAPSTPKDNHQQQTTAPTPDTDSQEQSPSPVPASDSNLQEEQQAAPTADNSGQKLPPSPTPAPKAAPATPGTQNTPSTGNSVSDPPSAPQGNPPISAQSSSLAQKATDTADASAAKANLAQTPEGGSRIPLLPVIAIVAAGTCIGAAACNAKGCGLFRRIAAKIRKILHK